MTIIQETRTPRLAGKITRISWRLHGLTKRRGSTTIKMADFVDERDVELEEGECSNSDSELIEFTSTSSVSCVPNKDNNTQNNVYRSRIPQIIINSDESDNDSDDDCPSSWKKTRSPLNNSPTNGEQIVNTPFVNPLLDSRTGINFANFNGQRRKNSIWGSVLTEQVLSQEVKLFGVDNSNIADAGRDVESYDFTKAKQDERPELDIDADEIDNSRDDIFSEVVDLEKEVLKHESRKRKRHARDRLGKRSYNKQKKRTLGVSANDDVSDVVAAITKGLCEPKVELFTRIVETIGSDLAIKIYYMTEDVEERGGMLTNDGFRRRTAGGVYIQLLKTDTPLSSEIIDSIFKDEQREWRETIRQQRKMKKAARKRNARRDMDIDRTETPAPTEDLEVLNAIDSNSEFENTDLPERPATPEPKDDSSDGQGEDDDNVDEDEEDISVAIAKARAAILKKQREHAGGLAADREKSLGEASMQSSNGSVNEHGDSRLNTDVEIPEIEDG